MFYTILTILVFLAVIALIFSVPFSFGVVAMTVLIENFKRGEAITL